MGVTGLKFKFIQVEIIPNLHVPFLAELHKVYRAIVDTSVVPISRLIVLFSSTNIFRKNPLLQM